MDTPGHEPSQKVTLTGASQSPCRRTVLLTRTWQVSGQRRGGSLRTPTWGPSSLVPSGSAAQGRFLGFGQEPMGGDWAEMEGGDGKVVSTYPLPHRSSSSRFSGGCPAAGDKERAGGGSRPQGWALLPGLAWGSVGGVCTVGRGVAYWKGAGSPGRCVGGVSRAGQCVASRAWCGWALSGKAGRQPGWWDPWGTHSAAGDVRAGHGPQGQHRNSVLSLAVVLRAVVHDAVDPGLVGLKCTGESEARVGIISWTVEGWRVGFSGWRAESERPLTWTSPPWGVRQAVCTHSPQHCPATLEYSEP